MQPTDPIPVRFIDARGDDDFSKSLDEIMTRELDARSIDSYADEALEDLVLLVERALAAHPGTEDMPNKQAVERQALSAVGLNPDTIELTLDHIANVADSTKRLDSLVMKKTRLVEAIIVPPDPSRRTEITAGDGSFERPKEMIPKLKTLLLLLEKGLDIPIEDDEAVTITQGVLRPNMMRGASYNLVEIPSLQRTVLVCDEVGNTTYVFDMAACQAYGINAEYLAMQMKPELNDLIEQDPTLGKRIDYSSQYVDQLGEALQTKFGETQTEPASRIDILKPKAPPAPENYRAASGIAREYRIATKTIQKAIAELGDSLGETDEYRFGPNTATGYSPEQIQQILDYLNIAPPAPEGYLSVRGIYREYGIDRKTTKKAIAELGDTLGETRAYRFGKKTATGYSPEQVRSTIDWINRNNNRVQLGERALALLTATA